MQDEGFGLWISQLKSTIIKFHEKRKFFVHSSTKVAFLYIFVPSSHAHIHTAFPSAFIRLSSSLSVFLWTSSSILVNVEYGGVGWWVSIYALVSLPVLS